MKRTDRVSRLIRAAPERIYRALIDPAAVASWLPPRGMTARIDSFDPVEGGSYRMALAYAEDSDARGKTSEHADVVHGHFVRLIPNEQVAQSVTFVSDDPAFAGEMTLSWLLEARASATRVTVICENVPAGIYRPDHEAGLASSLENLAAFTE